MRRAASRLRPAAASIDRGHNDAERPIVSTYSGWATIRADSAYPSASALANHVMMAEDKNSAPLAANSTSSSHCPERASRVSR